MRTSSSGLATDIVISMNNASNTHSMTSDSTSGRLCEEENSRSRWHLCLDISQASHSHLIDDIQVSGEAIEDASLHSSHLQGIVNRII